VAAAREAVDRGADAVEADVRQTADGHLVALFRETLAPTTNVEQVFPDRRPWRIESFTLAEVRRLDAGSWFGQEFTGERVPTLAELADALDGSDVELIVEIKSPQRYPGIGRRVLREIRSRPERYREVESFDLEFLRRLARLSPPVRLGAAKGVPPRRMAEVAPYLDAVNPPLVEADASYVERAHALGLEVKVWSVNTPESVRRASALGVDGIYSHRPDMVVDVLGR
jgi:glycerophosphoryl diester phosphodiesterase